MINLILKILEIIAFAFQTYFIVKWVNSAFRGINPEKESEYFLYEISCSVIVLTLSVIT